MKSDFVQTKEEALRLIKKRVLQFPEAEPLAIILHGSRVSGEAYPASDWDFDIVSKYKEKPVRGEFMCKNSFIECSFRKYEDDMSIQDFIDSGDYVPSQKLEVLWTKNKKIEEFLREVISTLQDKYKNQTRETWTDIRRHHLETWFLRNIFRISECDDSLRRQVYISAFIDQISRNRYYYFTNQWSHSISEGSKMIQQNDPKLYSLLVDLPRLKSKKSIKKSLTKIYEYFVKLDKENPSTMGESIYAKPGSRLQD